MSTAQPKARQRPGTAVHDKGRQSAAAVLDAAAALLAEEGAAGLSTRKVAARAGMHAGNLQYYFRTKQDLVRALLERYIDQSRDRVGTRMANSRGTAMDRLRSGIEEILADQVRVPDCALFRELWAMASHDREVAGAVTEFYDGYVRGMTAMLRDLEPRLTAARAQRCATLVVAMLEGLSVVQDKSVAKAPALRRLAAEIADVAAGMVRTA